MFHGWLVVGGAFVSHLLSYGILTVAFGVFFPFMADALGLGRGLLASISAAARLVSAALSPVVGPLVDRRGPPLVLAFGVLSLADGADTRGPQAAATREVSLGARAAARTSAFWLLIVSTNLAGLGFFGVNLHLFSYVTDRGLSAALAASVITYLYTLHTVAKPLWGLIAERVHVRYCIAGCYAGGALGVLLLVVGSGSVAWLVAFATVYGLTRGAQSFVTSLAWADYFGREAQGAIRGLSAPFRHLSAAAGPIVGGVLYDVTGDYRLAFAIFSTAFLAAARVAVL